VRPARQSHPSRDHYVKRRAAGRRGRLETRGRWRACGPQLNRVGARNDRLALNA
jgi:hypothetical protein